MDMPLCWMSQARNRVGWKTPGTLAIAIVLTGCASQGPLQPPTLNLPQPAEKLSAQRVGDRVELNWTTSPNTTDGIKLKGAISANICIGSPSATAATPPATKAAKKKARNAATVADPAACNAVQHLAVVPGPTNAAVELPANLTTGTPRAIAYSVELLNDKGRSAGPSAPVFVPSGAAPPTTGPLKISPRRESAVIEWPAAPSPAVVELRRTLIATPAGPVADAPKAKQAKPFAPSGKEPPRELLLRPDSAKDAGGTIDTTVRDGDTYTYVAQRVETLTLGGHSVEMRSQPSPVATFTYHDVFPPKPPTGLVLIPGGGFGEPPSIDLSWDANLESGILGYTIYRSSGGEFTKQNDAPIAVPSFRDLHVEPGQQYTYRVTAIDQRNNESAPGASATETLRK